MNKRVSKEYQIKFIIECDSANPSDANFSNSLGSNCA